MRTGSLMDWSVAFGCGPEDLTGVTRSVVKGARAIEDATIQLRAVVHEAPDRNLDEAVVRLERSACDVTAIVEDLHQQVVREFG